MKKSLSQEPQETVVDLSHPQRSYPDLIKELFDQYSSPKGITIWLFGSACLVAVLIFLQNLSRESIYFPFFVKDGANNLQLTLQSSGSGVLKAYGDFGRNKITLNDLLKVLVLLFLLVTFFKSLFSLAVSMVVKPMISFLNLIIPFATKPIYKLLAKIPRAFKEKKWVAEPQPLILSNKPGQNTYPQLVRKIPLVVQNFKYIRFKIHVLGNYPHWRAGIFVNGFDTKGDYVFHLYKDEGDNRILAKMTKRIFGKGHIEESDKELKLLVDESDILFELRAVEDDNYALYVNGQEIDRHEVPYDEFKLIQISAWADDRPYKIEFENIEFLG